METTNEADREEPGADGTKTALEAFNLEPFISALKEAVIENHTVSADYETVVNGIPVCILAFSSDVEVRTDSEELREHILRTIRTETSQTSVGFRKVDIAGTSDWILLINRLVLYTLLLDY